MVDGVGWLLICRIVDEANCEEDVLEFATEDETRNETAEVDEDKDDRYSFEEMAKTVDEDKDERDQSMESLLKRRIWR
ncbi:hypothetical protein LWI28_006668 [Acer negundo]|uniref:Uncharacterized protein n=1 Tax=Acer negundo TaxID=4023 RepID=A0AAD5NPM4_ACENE|nr:hypothetical protein LWI28_006668 [Acer negundo]